MSRDCKFAESQSKPKVGAAPAVRAFGTLHKNIEDLFPFRAAQNGPVVHDFANQFPFCLAANPGRADNARSPESMAHSVIQ